MNCVTVAQHYINQGYSVLPLRLDGSKSPSDPWKQYQTNMASTAELETWFTKDQAGIGVIAGAISGNLHIIDFDHDAEEHFERFWDDIHDQLPGMIEKLLVVSTPRPGWQVWFRQSSPPPGNQVLAWSEPLPTGEIDADGEPIISPLTLIETRGEGGYACAVGTPPATHVTGRSYELLHGSFHDLQIVTDQEAEAMLDICRGYSLFTPQQVLSKPGEVYQGEPRPGDLFNEHADFRRLLLDAGWRIHHEDTDGVEYLTRPGKQISDGYSATLGHIRTADDKPLFYVFSGNAVPFQSSQCYDAFGAFAAIKHGGDFKKAAAEARILYAQQLTKSQQAYRRVILKGVATQLPEAAPYKPFPVNLFPDVVNAYVTEHAAAIGIDPAYVGLPMLSVLAGLIGPARRLQIKRGFEQPSIIWTVTIGDVACGKSPGWKAAMKPAERIEMSLHSMMHRRDEEFDEQMRIYTVEKDNGNTPDIKPRKQPRTEQLTVNDATMEALLDLHTHNSKLILGVDELAGFIKSMDQYRAGKGRDKENWLSIHDGSSAQVNRKSEGYRIYLPRTSISVCGTIQPGVAASTLFTEEFIENGFAARILSANPPSEMVRWSDLEVPHDIDTAMNKLAEDLYALAMEPHDEGPRPLILPCTESAKLAYVNWSDGIADHAETLEKSTRDNWAKLRPMASRFALVFSIVKQLLLHPDGQSKDPVDTESMNAGIELARWFGNEFERNCIVDEHADVREHLEWIASKHPSGINARTLVSGRRSIKTMDDARIVLQTLTELGCGRLDGSSFIPNPAQT